MEFELQQITIDSSSNYMLFSIVDPTLKELFAISTTQNRNLLVKFSTFFNNQQAVLTIDYVSTWTTVVLTYIDGVVCLYTSANPGHFCEDVNDIVDDYVNHRADVIEEGTQYTVQLYAGAPSTTYSGWKLQNLKISRKYCILLFYIVTVLYTTCTYTYILIAYIVTVLYTSFIYSHTKLLLILLLYYTLLVHILIY